MALTNEELEQRMRAQTDMIQNTHALAGQAFQKANTMESKVISAQAMSAGADSQAQAALKSCDTTQKLLKELINEIKDLRDEGKLQQEQIEALRKEMNEYKELVNSKVNQCYQEIQASKVSGNGHTGIINVTSGGPYYGSTFNDVWCNTYTDDGNNLMAEVGMNTSDGRKVKLKAKVKEIEEEQEVTSIEDVGACAVGNFEL